MAFLLTLGNVPRETRLVVVVIFNSRSFQIPFQRPLMPSLVAIDLYAWIVEEYLAAASPVMDA